MLSITRSVSIGPSTRAVRTRSVGFGIAGAPPETGGRRATSTPSASSASGRTSWPSTATAKRGQRGARPGCSLSSRVRRSATRLPGASSSSNSPAPRASAALAKARRRIRMAGWYHRRLAGPPRSPYNPRGFGEERVAILESKLKRNDAFERRTAHWRGEMERLRGEEERLRLGGGAKAQEKQRAQGKMTARERVAALCDPGAPFLELGLWVAHGFYTEYGGAPAAGAVVGIGRLHGR